MVDPIDAGGSFGSQHKPHFAHLEEDSYQKSGVFGQGLLGICIGLPVGFPIQNDEIPKLLQMPLLDVIDSRQGLFELVLCLIQVCEIGTDRINLFLSLFHLLHGFVRFVGNLFPN